MRRFLILFLMLLIPVQFAWSAQQGLIGHVDDKLAALGMHAHMDDHSHASTNDEANHDDSDAEHNHDGHHDSHYHPVLSILLIESGLHLAEITSDGPISRPPASFISRIPPLFERPPSVRA